MTPLEKLQKLAEIMRQDTITPKEVEKFLKYVLDVIKKDKEEFKKLSSEHIDTIRDSVIYLNKENQKIKDELNRSYTNARDVVSKEAKALQKEFEKRSRELAKIASSIRQAEDGYTPVKGEDYFTKDEVEAIKRDVLAEIPEETGESIVDKVNSLSLDDENKIDAKHIKNLPTTNTGGGNISKAIYQLSDVNLSSLADGEVLAWDATLGRWVNTSPASGTGDVNGPASSTDDNFASFDGTSGKTIQDSGYSASSFAQLAFKTIAVSGQSDVVADAVDDTLTLVAGANVTITTDNTTDSITIASSGSGDTTNNYSSIAAPQLFNPDASAVSANTDDYTLATTNAVAFVTLNGQVLDDSEYSLVSSTLTVTPDNGFTDTSDEVLVFQHTFASSSTGGVIKTWAQKTGNYTITTADYGIEVTANSPTITLPTASGIGGQEFVVKNSSTGTVTVDANGSETIDGDLNVNLNPYDSLTVVSNGTNFIIV